MYFEVHRICMMRRYLNTGEMLIAITSMQYMGVYDIVAVFKDIYRHLSKNAHRFLDTKWSFISEYNSSYEIKKLVYSSFYEIKKTCI